MTDLEFIWKLADTMLGSFSGKKTKAPATAVTDSDRLDSVQNNNSSKQNLRRSMKHQTLLDKLQAEPPGSFHTLHVEKAQRMNAHTLWIASPLEVAQAIQAIPTGETRTIYDLRAAIAQQHGADTACPAKVLKYWKWMAAHTEEEPNSPYHIPWWRVMKDGKPSRHMPGGIENQLDKLKQEQK